MPRIREYLLSPEAIVFGALGYTISSMGKSFEQVQNYAVQLQNAQGIFEQATTNLANTFDSEAMLFGLGGVVLGGVVNAIRRHL
jgi:hypothetical protein